MREDRFVLKEKDIEWESGKGGNQMKKLKAKRKSCAEGVVRSHLRRLLTEGDFPGHPFRGNQYEDGEGGGSTAGNSKKRIPNTGPERPVFVYAATHRLKGEPASVIDKFKEITRALLKKQYEPAGAFPKVSGRLTVADLVKSAKAAGVSRKGMANFTRDLAKIA